MQNWTGKVRALGVDDHKTEQTSAVFAQIRVSYFIPEEWNIVKEISCLAISKGI